MKYSDEPVQFPQDSKTTLILVNILIHFIL